MLLRLAKHTLGYDVAGPSDGTPVVLLHAFPLDRRMWEAQVARRDVRTRMVTMDLLGLGESTREGSVDDAADDVVALCDRLEIARAIVCGMSLGGYVALAFARRHPDRLAGLLLADTRANPDDEAGRIAREEAITLVARNGVAHYASRLVSRLVTGRDANALREATSMGETQTAIGMVGALAALRDRPDATPGLAAIAVPTTVLVGSEDTVTPPEVARALAAAIPGARYLELEGAAHLSNLEKPREFSRAIDDLIARVTNK